MGRADFLDLGTSNAICDGCGFKYKHSDLKRDWRGLFLCDKCWSPRHPQEFLRGVPDNPAVENPRPDSTPTFNNAATNSVVTPAVPASGVPVTNTNIFAVAVTLTGGTVSKVVVANWVAQPVLGVYTVAPGDSIILTYSVAPTWAWEIG